MQLFIEENIIVMSAQPTYPCASMYVTKCLFQTQTPNANLKLENQSFTDFNELFKMVGIKLVNFYYF